MGVTEINKLTPNLHWAEIMKTLQFNVDTLIVDQPLYLQKSILF